MSLWDVPWCLGEDFNVVRFPFERSSGGRLTLAIGEFSTIISSCNSIDPPLEDARFTWSTHEEVLLLSRIDRFLFSIEQKNHQGVYQVVLPEITSHHVPITRSISDLLALDFKMCRMRWKVFLSLCKVGGISLTFLDPLASG